MDAGAVLMSAAFSGLVAVFVSLYASERKIRIKNITWERAA